MPPICFWWFMISQCTLAPIWGRRMYSLGLIPCLQSLMILYISSHQSWSWYFWYFSVLIFKILTLLILFSSYHQDSGREAPEGGEPDLLRPGLHHQAEVHGGELIIVIFIKIIMMIIIIRWRTSWGSSRSTSSGRRATGCSTMTRREEASGVLLLLFLSINFHFSVLSLYWYLAPECL